MHILVASWDVLDSIFLWPSSIAFPGSQPLPFSTFYVSILTKYARKEPDDERGWHIEIDIGISIKYVRTHACTKTVGYSTVTQKRHAHHFGYTHQ